MSTRGAVAGAAARRGRAGSWAVSASRRRRRCPAASPVKPLRSWVATLCRPDGCNLRPANDTSTPRSRATRGAGHRHRGAPVHRPVRVRRVGAAHHAGDHKRDSGRRAGRIQPQRRLFKGVGAVHHDHAFGAAVGRPARRRTDQIPVGRDQLANCPWPSRRRHRRRGRRPTPHHPASGRPHSIGCGRTRDRPAGRDDGHFGSHLRSSRIARRCPGAAGLRRTSSG